MPDLNFNLKAPSDGIREVSDIFEDDVFDFVEHPFPQEGTGGHGHDMDSF